MPRADVVLCSFLAVVAIPTAALAQANGPDLPFYNYEENCARFSAKGERFCLKNEQEAYERLQMLWPKSSASARMKALWAVGSPQRTYAYYSSLIIHLQSANIAEDGARDPILKPDKPSQSN